MQTSVQLLASIAKKKRWSYQRIAKELGQNHQDIDLIRNTQACLSEEHADKVAACLGLEPLYILACLRAERAKRKGMKSFWERIARGATAVAVTLSLVSPLTGRPPQTGYCAQPTSLEHHVDATKGSVISDC